LIFHLFKRSRFPRITWVCILVITGIFIPVICGLNSKPIMRIPALITGIAIGVFQTDHTTKKDRWIDLSIIAACFILGGLIATESFILKLPLFNLIRYGSRPRLWKDLTAPFVVIIAAYGFELLERLPLRFVNRLFDRLGRYSLELYMGHILVRSFATALFDFPAYGNLTIMLIFSYPAAVFLSKSGDVLLMLFKKLPLFKPAEHNL